MEIDESKKYAFGCGALMLLVLCIIYSMPLWSRQTPKPKPENVQAVKAERPPEPPKPVEVPKTASRILEELSSSNQQGDAYKLAMKYLKEGTESEKIAAGQALPSLLMNLFEDASRRQSFDEAVELYGQAKDICAKSKPEDVSGALSRLKDGIKYMRKRIAEMGLERSKEVIASGDIGKIDTEIQRAWLDGEAVLPEKETLDYLVGRWKFALGAGDAKVADVALRKAAEFAAQDVHSITYWKYRSGPLEEEMIRSFKYEELMALGKKSLADKEPLLAVAYLSSAIRMSSSGSSNIKVSLEEWLERQRLFSESLLQIGTLAEEGKLPGLPPDNNFENKVEILLQMAAGYANEAKHRDKSANPPEKKYEVAIRAWEELFKLYQGKLRRICETQELHRVVGYCEDVMFQNTGSYISFYGECFGPGKVLDTLPGEIKKELEKKSKDPREQLFALQEMIRLKAYSPPFEGKDDFVRADLKAKYSLGTDLLEKGRYAEAFSYLRPIIRGYPESEEASRIKKDIADKIDEARSGRDFNSLYGLASFLIGEMKGKSLPSELAGKLVESLDAAIEFYKDGSPMKRAFMLSLKADVLGDTEKGREAHAEAMKVGFEAVKGMPLKATDQPALKLPSLVPGCSVDAIKNSTPYHLMAFYDGPEKFFVRLNPYSKGSLALLDGDYEIAAVVTGEDILPYRSKYKYAKEFLLHTYHIVEGGGKDKKEYSDFFSGKFIMLRAPKGNDGIVLDPDSGFMKP